MSIEGMTAKWAEPLKRFGLDLRVHTAPEPGVAEFSITSGTVCRTAARVPVGELSSQREFDGWVLRLAVAHIESELSGAANG